MLNKAEINYSITEKEVLAALWAMEKLQYHLGHKEFTLVTDHKAILSLKTKLEFGSQRINRWFERLEKFNFKTVYRKGEQMVEADSLSRAPPNQLHEEREELSAKEREILELHSNNNHRKGIRDLLNKNGIDISESRLRLILNRCDVCIRKDKKYIKSAEYDKTSKPGEIFAVDILQINAKEKVILGIDYFTRKLYGMAILSKHAGKILKFLHQVYSEFKFKKLMTDNGGEFSSIEMKQWLECEKIEHEFKVPYYHQSNGRIERANRTIRTALKKINGMLRTKLSKVLENYNSMKHRGIEMSPN